jgi:hypothetical protein
MVSPPQLFGHQPVLHQLGADRGRVGAGLVDLVDGHQDGNLGGLGVLDGLDGLRHRAFLGRDDDDHDVGHLGAARTHGGERLVAGVSRNTTSPVAVWTL